MPINKNGFYAHFVKFFRCSGIDGYKIVRMLLLQISRSSFFSSIFMPPSKQNNTISYKVIYHCGDFCAIL